MENFKKIFLFLFSIIIFIVLIFITFSGKTFDDISEKFTLSTENGVFLVEVGDNDFQEVATSKNLSGSLTGVLYMERFHDFNTLLFSPSSKYSKSEKSDLAQISLGEGEFFLDIEDVTQNINIFGSGFTLQTIGGGRAFISTRSPSGNITLFSIDSVLKINLLDSQTQKEKTQVYLYPHMSLTFSPSRNSSLDNADRIRISTVQNFDYYNGSIFDGDFLNYIQKVTGDSQLTPFIKEVLSYQETLDLQSKKVSNIVSSTLPIIQIPGIYYIENYKQLFLNQTKKIAYLKNIAFQAFAKFIQSSKYSKDDYDDMIQYFQELQQLNPHEYELFINGLKPIIYSSLLRHNEERIEGKQKLLLLVRGNTNFSFAKNGVASTMLLSDIFRQYDLQSDEKGFYEGITEFINQYTGDIGLKESLQKVTRVTQKTYALDYLTFFLEKILVPNEDKFSESNFLYLIQIFDIYNNLSQIVYTSGDDSLSRTALYVNLTLIKHLLSLLDSLYFEGKRNSSNLLVRKLNADISSDTIKLFTKNINYVYDYYKQNQRFLDIGEEGKDITIPSDYENIYKLYQEYFSSLLDYTKYSVEFDPAKRGLLDINDITKNTDLILTREKFIDYFSQFSGIDFSSAQIIVSDNFYEAKDIFINGQRFSFHFFPSNNGQISNIQIDGQDKNSSYKLDLIRSAWLDAFSKATGKDRDKVDFRNFFYLTFQNTVNEDNPGISTQISPDSSTNEDSVVRVFKSTTLLSPTEGLFRNIKSLTFRYNDITVTFSSGEHPDVSFQNVLFSQTILTGGTPYNLYGKFSGKFVADKDNPLFSNMTFQIYQAYDRDPSQYFYNGAVIKIIGNIQLSQINEKLQQIGETLYKLLAIESTLITHYTLSDIDIKYILPQDKIILKFATNGEVYTINMTGDMIDSINLSGKNILNNRIRYVEINNYLP